MFKIIRYELAYVWYEIRFWLRFKARLTLHWFWFDLTWIPYKLGWWLIGMSRHKTEGQAAIILYYLSQGKAYSEANTEAEHDDYVSQWLDIITGLEEMQKKNK